MEFCIRHKEVIFEDDDPAELLRLTKILGKMVKDDFKDQFKVTIESIHLPNHSQSHKINFPIFTSSRPSQAAFLPFSRSSPSRPMNKLSLPTNTSWN